MKFEDIKKLHEKKFREKLGALRHRRRAPRAGAREGRGARCAPARKQDLRDARLCALVEQAADARRSSPSRWRRSARRVHRRASPRWCRCSTPPRRAQESALSIFTRSRIPAISAPSCARWRGSGISAACCSPDSVDLHNGKVVRASMGAIFHVPVEFDVPLDVVAKTFRAHCLLDLGGRADCVAGIPGIRLLRVRQRSARPAARADERARRAAIHHPGNGRHRIAERGGDREHLPVRAQPRV